MKRLLITALILCGFFTASADHISGGEIFYTYLGNNNGTCQYKASLRLFMLCSSIRQFDNPAIISVFNKNNNQRISDNSVTLNRIENISLNNTNLCISNPPIVCYKVAYYEFNLSLPSSADGYIISYQVNFRVDNMNNLSPGYDRVGATFAAEIPGDRQLAKAFENNSAKFGDNDLSIVCANNEFSYKFTATDKDGDELRYQLCLAYEGGGRTDFGDQNTPPQPPPYSSLPYRDGYSGSSPLGQKVNINATTGMITGIAPSSGTYVIAVCVFEYRNNVLIATQRKDLQITIAPCTFTSATLPPEYMLCRDSKTISVSNNSISPLIHSYNWDVLTQAGTVIYSSAEPLLSYTFIDTGSYNIKLVVNRGEKCIDSAASVARVYPGFKPGFDYSGICFTKPTLFKDISTAVYGTVNKWNWYFDDAVFEEAVTDKNPTYTFNSMGTKDVQLIVSNTVGCIDTITKPVAIIDKPPINLAFRDTLICLNDAVQLNATGDGLFNWSPAAGMLNANSASPIVSPVISTLYYVDLNSSGCLKRDSVMINVVDHVTLKTMNDTTVCSNDAVELVTVSDGLKFEWSPAAQLSDAKIKSPVAFTADTTTYHVTATIGSCTANDEVVIRSVPYPYAYAGADTVICFNTVAQLNAVTNGSSYIWSHAETLSNATILSPSARPAAETTMYILSAYDTKGCPKPGLDTVSVTMLPKIEAFAGRDTAVVINQPLQLNATGGNSYTWSPPTGLSSANIANPVAIHHEPTGDIKYKVVAYNEAGCKDSAYIVVKIFKTLPTIFVPGAFTPNADGKNDFLRPIAAGMKEIEYFRIFNRWGQMLYNTVNQSRGWDGTINGNPQSPGVFIWMVKAVDYNGNPYFQKGTVVLIR